MQGGGRIFVGKRSMMELKCTLYLIVLYFYMLSVTKTSKCRDGTVYNGYN